MITATAQQKPSTTQSVRRLCSLLVLLLACFYAFRAAWFFAHIDGGLHFDEGYIAAFGERLIDGHFLPYVDAVSQRGPVLYWAAACAQFVSGRFNWTGIRLLASASYLIAVLSIFLTGWGARRSFAGALASLLFVVVSLTLREKETVFGLLGETLALPLSLLALAAITFALRRCPHPGAEKKLLVLTGILCALAGLSKQTYLPLVLSFFAWCLLQGWVAEPPWNKRQSIARALWLLLGWGLVAGFVVGVYALAGELHDFWYWFYRFNREVYMGPFDSARAQQVLGSWLHAHGWLSLGLVLLILQSVTRCLTQLGAAKKQGAAPRAHALFELMIASQLLIAVLASLAPLRFFSQYFLPPLPWAMLLLGLKLDAATQSWRPTRASAWSCLMLSALCCGGASFLLAAELKQWQQLKQAGRWASAYPEPTCQELDEYTRPGDALFIWGFDSDIYITCERRSASRYLYSTMVQGVVVPFWQEAQPQWVAENARENLLKELETGPVPLLLESPTKTRGSSLLQVSWLRDYVRQHYERLGEFLTKDGRVMKRWVRKGL